MGRSLRHVHVGTTETIKRYADSAMVEWEVALYQLVPWACPPLIDHDKYTLVIETCPVAVDYPTWQPVTEMLALLDRIHNAGIAHRDVHVGNIVSTDNGPRLIDWEHALVGDIPAPFDLIGPEASGLPEPTPGWPTLWWAADHPWSPVTFWRL